jgi:hypothetical protein
MHFKIPAAIHEEPIFSGEAGLLGNGLLAKSRLTIDEPRNRILFDKNREFEDPHRKAWT